MVRFTIQLTALFVTKIIVLSDMLRKRLSWGLDNEPISHVDEVVPDGTD